jgi:hypothetical protein
MSPTATFSRTKWISSSICFVRLWCTGFLLMYMVDTLSQKTIVADESGQPSSPRRERSHEHSATAFATPWYSASALERETVVCRFEDHETRASPRKMQNPEVERLVSGHPARSASEYAVSVVEVMGRSWIPMVGVPLT